MMHPAATEGDEGAGGGTAGEGVTRNPRQDP